MAASTNFKGIAITKKNRRNANRGTFSFSPFFCGAAEMAATEDAS